MRRHWIASLASTLFVFAGFACGAADSDLYARMSPEAQSASVGAALRGSDAPIAPPTACAVPSSSAQRQEPVADPEEVGIVAGSEAAVGAGSYPPEIIARVLRRSMSPIRLCYKNGLRTTPQLRGRVSVRFMVGRDGNVVQAVDNGSTLPDPAVVSCVVNAFKTLSFPRPSGGRDIVLTYPLDFRPPPPVRA